MSTNLIKLKKELKKFANPKRAKVNAYFFKTGKGHYGKGDVFVGVSMPDLRKVVKDFLVENKDFCSLHEIKNLLEDKIHEYRMAGVIILVSQFETLTPALSQREREARKKIIYNFYLKNSKKINNWDLVDSSADKIVGEYLLDKKQERKILYSFAVSNNLWQRRIAIIATFSFIRKNDFKDALKISEILLNDEHDLIHKAVGWMLREVGKKDLKTLEKFLQKHIKKMPRTMLRYAIEKFPEEKRQMYLRR